MLAFRERGERPCPYVEEVIGRRLAEVNHRMRELRELKHDLSELQRRMADADAEPATGRFCHYIETAAGAGGGEERRA